MKSKNDCGFTFTNGKTGQVFNGTAKELLRVMFNAAEIDAVLADRFSEDEAQKIVEGFANYCEQDARP